MLRAAFIQAVDESFRAAVRAAGSTERRVTLADRAVTLRVAPSTPTVDLTRAFAHLARDDAAPPALTIAAWDAVSCGVEPPPVPEGIDQRRSAGAVAGSGPPGGRDARPARGPVYYHREPGLRVSYQPVPGVLNVLDTTAGHAWHWVRDLAAVPYWDSTSPFRQILHWWLRDQRCVEVHGGAVGIPGGGGVLLGGKGGSGKSTSALASLGSGLRFAGDDYVAVTESRPARVHSLYCSAKLDPRDLDRFPHLRPLVSNIGALPGDKAVLYVDRLPRATVTGFPLRAILLPTVAGAQPPRLVPVAPAAALRALAPSTVLQLQPASQDGFTAIATLVREVPAFRLELGPDVTAVPDVIARLLSELDERCPA